MKQTYNKKDTYLQKKGNKLLMNKGQYNMTMKYQRIKNLLDNTSSQQSNFRTKNCVEIRRIKMNLKLKC